MKSSRSQRRNLIAPRIPKLRKTMKQDDERTAAGFDVVNGDLSDRANTIGDFQLRDQRHRRIVWEDYCVASLTNDLAETGVATPLNALRVADIFKQVFGLEVNRSTLARALLRLGQKAEPTY